MRILAALRAAVQRAIVQASRSRCERGHHATLVWLTAMERRVPIPNTPRLNPTEAFYASGMGRYALWNGWCPRCGRAVEWADHDPIRDMEDGDALAAHEAQRVWNRSVHRGKQQEGA